MLPCHFSWQVQYLVMLQCHFSWQAHYLVKFGYIPGARNVAIFFAQCVSEPRKVTSANGRVRDDDARIMVGESSAIVNDASSVFQHIFFISWNVIFVAGALFGDVGG